MRADRLLAIIMLLQAKGKVTAQSLANELEVSRRTILRDVEALSIAGVPIYCEGGHGGGIELDEHYRVTLTGLHEAEAQTLFIVNNSRLLDDIGLGNAAESTLRKLFAALPRPHQPSIDHLRQRIFIDPVWWWHDLQALPLAELQQAIYEDRYIAITYENYEGAVIERELEPYGLVAKASLWYLVARRDGGWRTYRVSRFQQVTLLDKWFERLPTFDLSQYWEGNTQAFLATLAQFSFTLRLNSERMAVAKWYTPTNTEILSEPDADGWLIARFEMENLELAKLFVLTLGAQAVVIEPPALREAVVTTTRAILEHYTR